MTKVVVVDDDPTMAEMVSYNLRRQGFEVEASSDGVEGLQKARDRSTSLVILDLMLPGIDGLEIARQVRQARPELPLLMLTARGEEEMKLKGFEAGVDDYLTKPFSMEELIARVKALMRRTTRPTGGAPQELIAFGDLRISPRDFRCWVKDSEIKLRPKEFSLIAALAEEPGRLFDRVELAERIWGYSHLGDTRTIDTHVKNLRRKIEGQSDYRYIETVRGAGYRFRVQPKGT